jgi:hypothetical protein
MYDYRRWTPGQRADAVAQRIADGLPWHSPPHFEAPGEYRIVTATCFEHRRILSSPERLLCQLVHGAATYGGKLNRVSLKRCVMMMMQRLLPALLLVWIDHGTDEDWARGVVRL